ncbi:MAG: hypothetical protein D6811_11955, partial [Alphaproteobacteria bacterium]
MPVSTLFHAFLVVAAPLLALAALAGWRAPRARQRLVLALAAAGLGAAHLTGAELLGRPKPARLELIRAQEEEARVLGTHYVEGRAIWLWLVLPDEQAPRAYELPWSREAAQALRQAQAQAEANGTELRMREPFRRHGADGAAVFYAPPPPPLPRKTGG